MSVKWQSLVKYAGGSAVSLSVALLFILNFTGMEYSHDGDKVCTDCYSEITIASAIWEICAEHSGEDRDVVFKKQSRSRRIWLNLDKITEFTITDPVKQIELLIPATKSSSTINHEEYGYLRPVKDGDCIVKRSTKANNYKNSRIILHGQKEAFETVKWSFIVDYWNTEAINIDPFWLPITSNVTGIYECDNVTFLTPQDTIILSNVSIFSPFIINTTSQINHCLNLSGPDTNCSMIDVNTSISVTGQEYNVGNFTKYNECTNSSGANTSCVSTQLFIANDTYKDIESLEEQNITVSVLVNGSELRSCELLGYEFGTTEISVDDGNNVCNYDGTFIYCDTYLDGNGDGFCDSGESCWAIDPNTEQVVIDKRDTDKTKEKKPKILPQNTVKDKIIEPKKEKKEKIDKVKQK